MFTALAVTLQIWLIIHKKEATNFALAFLAASFFVFTIRINLDRWTNDRKVESSSLNPHNGFLPYFLIANSSAASLTALLNS